MMFQFTQKQMIPFVVSLAMFMEALDTTVINTAIPIMAQSLNVHPVDLKIALISYLVSLAIFIPISGWIADKFGIKRVFISALTIFIFSSFWCGFTDNLWELVIARSIQGIGGSLMLPVGRLILVRFFERHELISNMSRVVIVASLGMMLGPVLGGFITHYVSWRWIFWINIPVSILAIWLTYLWLPSTPSRSLHPLDKLGFILFGTGLACLTLGLSALSESTVSRSNVSLLLIISIGLLIAYVLHSRKRKNPIVKVELFRTRTFRISAIGNLLARLGFGGVPFLVPLLLQIGLGYPAQISGLLLAPTAIGVLIMKPLTLTLLRLIGYKRLLMVNTLLVGVSLWTFTRITPNTSFFVIAFFTFLFGFLISLQYSAMNSLAYAETSPENLSAATSIMSTLQQLSQSFGVAVSALFIRYFSSDLQLSLYVFHSTFLAMSLMTLFSMLIFTTMKPEDGHEMIEPVGTSIGEEH